MSRYKLEFHDKAKKDIQKIDKSSQKHIIKKLKFFLAQKDPLAYAINLVGKNDGQYRWRIGVYRVVFDVEEDVIVILRVQHRREVYRP